MCHEAAMKALEDDIDSELVQPHHFDYALNVVKPRISQEQLDYYENYKQTKSMKNI